MAKKETKSQAEIYREERKKRIAKAGKANAKKASATKAGKAVKRAVAALVALAIVLGGVYYVLSVTYIKSNWVTALTVNGEKVTEAQFYYYYYLAYQQAASNAQNYADYASMYGMTLIDTSVSPDEQEYSEGVTWADELAKEAKTAAQSNVAFYKEAQKAMENGFEVDEEEMQTTIDETIESIKTSAESNGYSFSAYLRSTFHLSEKALRKQLEMEQICSAYQEWKQTQFTDGVTDADLNAELEANPNTYGLADVRCYALKYDTLTQEDGETDDDFAARTKAANADVIKKAEAINKAVTDEASFKDAVADYEAELAKAAEAEAADEAATDTATDTAADDAAAEDVAETDAEAADEAAAEEEETDATLYENATYSTISSVAEKTGADYAFAAERKAGDHKVIEGESGAYVVYVISPKSLDSHSVTVRYCLVAYNSDFSTYADEDERKTAEEEANKLKDEWDKGEKTEDTFATICVNNSDDTTTSADGGKIDVRLNTMVSAFEDWCFDANRKAGDCDVIEATEYGYFLVYYVSDNKDDLDWKATASSTLSNNSYNTYTADLLAEDGEYAIVANDRVVNSMVKDFCKKIKRNLAMSSLYGSSY